jgi:shikimate kinase
MLRGKNLQELFNERISLYEKYADHMVCWNKDIYLVVEEIKRLVGSKRFMGDVQF